MEKAVQKVGDRPTAVKGKGPSDPTEAIVELEVVFRRYITWQRY